MFYVEHCGFGRLRLPTSARFASWLATDIWPVVGRDGLRRGGDGGAVWIPAPAVGASPRERSGAHARTMLAIVIVLLAVLIAVAVVFVVHERSHAAYRATYTATPDDVRK